MKPLTPPSRPAFAARPASNVPPSPPDRQRLIVLVLAALLLLAVVACLYLWMQLKQAGNAPEAAQAAEQAEVLALVEEVGKLIVLPEGEVPTIATVQDPAVLQDQPFFARAKTGDKVLLYTAARKAILYDPVAKKIVEVAPINVGDAAPQPVEPVEEE